MPVKRYYSNGQIKSIGATFGIGNRLVYGPIMTQLDFLQEGINILKLTKKPKSSAMGTLK